VVTSLPKIKAETLVKFATSILTAKGTPQNEAQIVAQHLVRSNLSGHDSHGILRLPYYLKVIEEGKIVLGAEPRIVRETASTALVDGNWNFGQITGKFAMELAVEKAKTTGIGMTALFNVDHTGRVGEYPEIAIEHDMVGIVFGGGNKNPQVVAPGGLTRVIGPNPLAIGVPANQLHSFLLDMSTSIVAGGKISWYLAQGKPVPAGWIIDSEGNPTTNPADFRPPLKEYAKYHAHGKPLTRGSLLPFGNYKGFGLGVFIQMLGGYLAESGKGTQAGFIFIAIDISKFRPIAEFKNNIDHVITTIKNSKRRPGVNEILIAGEPEFNARTQRLKDGIHIEPQTLHDLQEIGQQLGIQI
jgi:LDH2 family malate/lactate/ureidoglycolate dehydrogenase